MPGRGRGGRGRGGRGGRGARAVGGSAHAGQPGRGPLRGSRPAVDPSDFERQLEAQRARQRHEQEHATASSSAGAMAGEGTGPAAAVGPETSAQQQQAAPPAQPPSTPAPRPLPGFVFDEERGRYFRRIGGAASGEAPASELLRERQREQQQQQPPPLAVRSVPLTAGAGLFRRLAERERRGSAHQSRAMAGSVGKLVHMEMQSRFQVAGTMQDVDFCGNRVLVSTRGGVLAMVEFGGDAAESRMGRRLGLPMNVMEIASCHTAITRVRWRVLPGPDPCPAADTLSFIEAGEGDRNASIMVCRMRGDEPDGGAGGFHDDDGPGSVLRFERFSLQRDVWGIDWDTTSGHRILAGVAKNEPVYIVDVARGANIVATSHRLPSDCFSPCWVPPASPLQSASGDHVVLLGLRNGELLLADLRSASKPIVMTRMGNIVDQQEALPGYSGVLVSDRLGSLRVVDWRRMGRTLRDIIDNSDGNGAGAAGAGAGAAGAAAIGGGTLATTGFALDPSGGRLCMTVSPSDNMLKLFDLSQEGQGLVKSWPVIGENASRRLRRGPPSLFMARRWMDAGAGADVYAAMDFGPGSLVGGVPMWAPLWVGDRCSGQLLELGLYREPPTTRVA